MPPLPSLILVDMLGVKARWVAEGATGAVTAFEHVAQLVSGAMADAPPAILGAELESDTALVACTSTNAALRYAKALFLNAFTEVPASRERTDRTWLRGVLVPRPAELDLESMRVARTTVDRVRVNELVQLTNRPYPTRLKGFHDFSLDGDGRRRRVDATLGSDGATYQVRGPRRRGAAPGVARQRHGTTLS